MPMIMWPASKKTQFRLVMGFKVLCFNVVLARMMDEKT